MKIVAGLPSGDCPVTLPATFSALMPERPRPPSVHVFSTAPLP